MTTVVSIVEGDGEVAALPILLRRICEPLLQKALRRMDEADGPNR